ncbi:MAG: outer membrane protein assembly factor BamB [Gammaproteobacteria bacterium]|nr:MAG: outer membrane protein assembly factor BamB [Gammaproteobacteria bacterium]QMU62641.1 MAG: outer membrane protein assembly factor BamB [Gammaproteobacteria bacterium]
MAISIAMRNCINLLLIIVIASSLQLAGCSVLSKPKEWFEKEENPREPAKLAKIEAEKISVQQVWRNSVGNLEESYNKIRPYITDNRVYLSDAEGRVEAWQREDGKHLWSVNLKEDISGGVNGGEGIVAIGTENGEVVALDADDGSESWRTKVPSEAMSLSEARYGVIAVRTNDNSVHALDVRSGNISWSAGKSRPALTLRGASQPKVVGDLVLVGFDDGKLMAINLRDGEPVWEVPVSIPKGRSELERMSDVDGEFAYLDGIVFAASFNGRVVAIDLDTGKTQWTKDLSSYAGLSVDRERVYVTDADDSVWGLDISTGATLWRQDKFLYRELTAPQVMGNYIVVGDYDGYLHWLSKEDGKIIGRDNVAGDKIEVAPIIINNRAYVLANNGSLSVLQYRK